jgi:SAM-dependent methyltransferase
MNQPEAKGRDSSTSYVLGHSDHELERLQRQARIKDPITRGFFVDAGIGPGMRVLDVGSGAGDVAFLAADLVGDGGEVVGVDRSEEALQTARARAEERSLRTVSFVRGDPIDLPFERPFDAVVGRYVLQFQPDPSAMLRGLAEQVAPGGVIVFHELDWTGVRSFPPASLYDASTAWCVETLRRTGTERHMGMKLEGAFVGAGLPAPTMRMESLVGGNRSRADVLALTADLVRTLTPDIIRLGVANESEIGLETLSDRMLAEAEAVGSVIVGRSEVGAWTRVPTPNDRSGSA